MPRYEHGQATVEIFTSREGVLSRVGHDLRLEAERFEIEVDDAGTRITASASADSVRVRAARQGAADVPGALSASDLRQIDGHIQKDVLESHRHPRVEFQSSSVEKTDAGYRVRGNLRLRGVDREIEFAVREEAAAVPVMFVAEFVLAQRAWGITPFRAMLGALRVHDDVRVVVRVPKG